jgi:filamentous hemagglutinin
VIGALEIRVCFGFRASDLGVRSANPTSVVEREALDWSVVSKSGETRWQHLQKHGADIPGRPGLHGVFDNDPAMTTMEAWYRAQRLGIMPTADGTFVVPMGRRIGWQGGSLGTGDALENVTIHTINGRQIITAYPTR